MIRKTLCSMLLLAAIACATGCKFGVDEPNTRIFQGSLYSAPDSLPAAFKAFELKQTYYPGFANKSHNRESFSTDANGGFRVTFKVEMDGEPVELYYGRLPSGAVIVTDSSVIDFGRVYVDN
jgi:hypothetical protein